MTGRTPSTPLPDRIILLNQMAGPLFRELSAGVASDASCEVVLYTGHPDTLNHADKIAGLRIQESPVYDRSSKVRRLLSWLHYAGAATRFFFRPWRRDVFLISSNPPVMSLWFWLFAKVFRHRYCILVYDIHPDVLIHMGVMGERNLIGRVWSRINRLAYKDATKVITIGHHMAKRIQQQMPGGEKPVVIPPWVDTDVIRPLARAQNPLDKEFDLNGRQVILYSGNMGVSHDIDSMVEAARILRHRDDLVFVFIGEGEKWKYVQQFKEQHALDNIRLYPFQEESRLKYTLSLATLSLVSLDVGAEDLMVPSKAFYYLAAGSPLLGICQGDNELRDIIDDNDVGRCIPPGEPKKLAEAIETLLSDEEALSKLADNARATAESNYSQTSGLRRFRELYESIAWITPKVSDK